MAEKKKRKMPNAFTTLFLIIIFVAIMTWIIPAGQYEVLEDGSFVPGTYHVIESNPQGIWDVLAAPFLGFLGNDLTDGAMEVAIFILSLGGFLNVVTKTGAIDAGIGHLIRKEKDNISKLIWVLMFVFALGGSTYGMAEETMAFYPLLIPIMVTVGMDSLVAVAVVLVGSGMGVLASTVNPFATGIASDMAGVSMADGILLRGIMLAVFYVIGAIYVSRYAKKVQADHTQSLIYDKMEEQREKFRVNENAGDLSKKQKTVLWIFALTFVIMIVALIPWPDLLGGPSIFDKIHDWLHSVPFLGDLVGRDALPFGSWYLVEITMLFFTSAIIIAWVYGIKEDDFVNMFLDGMADLLSVAMICAIARGIQVIMNDGQITATILYWGEQALSGLSKGAFTALTYIFYIPMSILIPSTSGLAAATMGIMAPLGQFAGVAEHIIITAYQSGAGIVNLVTPTSGVVMGALAIADLDLGIWLKFMRNLLVITFVVSIALLLVGVYVL
ncbi:YfcC family protein [Allofustis seminis]|uniref:YfcC family protein n=1 Tax=Allofustis seminis TaxID=166939 RepID=UPI00035EBC97|nr:YfcC family protein [Allofustis seminis]